MNSRKLIFIRASFVVVGLAAWFGTQALLGSRPDPADEPAMNQAGDVVTAGDRLLTLTEPAYKWFAANPARWKTLLITSSAAIDVLTFWMLGISIFGKTLRPFVGLLLLFGLRQVCQAFSALPAPAGMIWEDPGFPSILVTYGVANDFFFSGHTAIAVYGAVELGRGGSRARTFSAVLLALFLITSVILVRAHYMMDIFAGIIAALLAANWASWLAPKIDRRLEGRRES